MAGFFVTFVFLAVTVNAIVRSVSAKFWLGVFLGILRAVLLIAGTVLGFAFLFQGASNTHLVVPVVVTAVLGPLVSCVAIFVTYRRKANVPALEEDAANRLLLAWVPVPILDAMLVVVAIMGIALASDP